MFRDYLTQLCDELSIASVPKINEPKIYPFPLGDFVLAMKDLDPGLGLQAPICLCPEKNREELFIYLLQANVLGQGVGLSRLGLDKDEKFLTLSLGLPYEMNYQMFKETIEEFVNYLEYWKEQVHKIQ